MLLVAHADPMNDITKKILNNAVFSPISPFFRLFWNLF